MSKHDRRHGGPYDRGSADFYYWREESPHYFEGPTAITKRIEIADMTADEIAEYRAGYKEETDRKDWN